VFLVVFVDLVKIDWWIGLHCKRMNNYFEWTSEEPVLYTNWYRREPNNFNNNENCVEMYQVNNVENIKLQFKFTQLYNYNIYLILIKFIKNK